MNDCRRINFRAAVYSSLQVVSATVCQPLHGGTLHKVAHHGVCTPRNYDLRRDVRSERSARDRTRERDDTTRTRPGTSLVTARLGMIGPVAELRSVGCSADVVGRQREWRADVAPTYFGNHLSCLPCTHSRCTTTTANWTNSIYDAACSVRCCEFFDSERKR
jgi:hypothetical protein